MGSTPTPGKVRADSDGPIVQIVKRRLAERNFVLSAELAKANFKKEYGEADWKPSVIERLDWMLKHHLSVYDRLKRASDAMGLISVRMYFVNSIPDPVTIESIALTIMQFAMANDAILNGIMFELGADTICPSADAATRLKLNPNGPHDALPKQLQESTATVDRSGEVFPLDVRRFHRDVVELEAIFDMATVKLADKPHVALCLDGGVVPELNHCHGDFKTIKEAFGSIAWVAGFMLADATAAMVDAKFRRGGGK